MEQEQLTKKERRALRRQRQEEKKRQREEERQTREQERKKSKKKKRVILWAAIVVVVAASGYLIAALASQEKVVPYSKGQVHWHAKLRVFMCGEEKLMPSPFGSEHLGTPLLHTHDDRLIHIEGTVWKPEDIMLGKYMGAIGQNFKDEELIDKRNGDLCNGVPGKVKLFVNGKENPSLTRYIIQDDDEYELRFEP